VGTVAIKAGSAVSNVQVLGSNKNLIKIFNFKIAYGDFFAEDNDQGRRIVVLGADVAKNLFPNEIPVGKLVKINGSEHRVVGVTLPTGQSLGFNFDEIAFIPTRAAMRLFNEDKLIGIRLRAKSKASVADAVEEVKEIIKARHNGEEDFTVITQGTMLETMNKILGMLTYMLAGIAMISMLVGGIGIMNIMLVSVTERTREIGIRRAVGAKQSDIMKQFLAEALALSLIGGLIGLAGSAAITYIITFATDKFDMRAPIWILVPSFAISTLTGVIFGVWPARKAAKIETIEALRYE
jgi:putative ABC transport system permease protein